MHKPLHLLNPKHVREVRESLHKEQGFKDALTGHDLHPKDAVCDHNHKTQFVRGIIHRQANAVLGKIENLWTRYLKFWYNGTLPQFLRSCADYLEQGDDLRYLHPGWLEAIQTRFNTLNEKQKTAVLAKLGQTDGKNSTERKTKFKAAIKDAAFTYAELQELIAREKE